jgi:DNA-nicking Smr family endonuclease
VARRGKRALTEEERTLWAHVTRHIKPLSEQTTSLGPDQDLSAEAAAFADAISSTATPRSTEASAPRAKPHKQARPRRDVAPQARLDLHGMTEDEAHRALVQFIMMSLALRCRRILIITGKGRSADQTTRSHSSEGRGILRRLVPLWLEVEALRPFVAAVVSAPIELGGPGALVVDLNPRAKSP